MTMIRASKSPNGLLPLCEKSPIVAACSLPFWRSQLAERVHCRIGTYFRKERLRSTAHTAQYSSGSISVVLDRSASVMIHIRSPIVSV